MGIAVTPHWPSPLELSIRSDVVGTSPSGVLGLRVSHVRICAVVLDEIQRADDAPLAGGTAWAWDGRPGGSMAKG